jgi:RNA polymerase sigma factor (TIGR02999 family)
MISAEVDLTTYLAEWNAGNGQARDTLLTLAYGELRSLAAGYLSKERSAPALEREALVHENYLRLASQKLPDWESRSHFFGVAAYLMRQILVDRARRNKREKRGGGEPAAVIEEANICATKRDSGLLALDDAMFALARLDERQGRIN